MAWARQALSTAKLVADVERLKDATPQFLARMIGSVSQSVPSAALQLHPGPLPVWALP